jgi:hypothetical protein
MQEEASGQVRAWSWNKLKELQAWLSNNAHTGKTPAVQAHFRYHLDEIKRFMEDPKEVKLPKAPELPDGSPIGCGVN